MKRRQRPRQMGMRPRRLVSPVAPFIVQACFISWFAWLPGLLLAPRLGYELYTGADFLRIFRAQFVNTTHVAIVILFFIAVYGPLVSALGITQRAGGDAAVRDLVRRTAHWRLPARWYLAALALPIITQIPAVAVAHLTGVAPAEPVLPFAAGMIPLFLFYQLLTSGMEEPAWRGFLLPYLRRRYSTEVASYMVGGLWMLWRLPYVVLTNQGPGLPLALVAFAVHLIGSSVIFAWLYANTGSVFLAILYHAVANVAMTLAASWMGTHPGPHLVVGLTSWGIALVLLRWYGSELLVRR